jgi:glycosyltransferase involved in cell wall biosynthesis
MRLLYLIPSLSGGGTEHQLCTLAPEIARMGHKVYIAYIYNGPCKPELPNLYLYNLKARTNYDPYLLWQLFRLIRRIKPDIIHTYNPLMDILGGTVSRISKIPWIASEPSSANLYRGTWKDRLRILIGAGASAIVTNSKGGQAYWNSRLPLVKTHLVRNGISFNEIEKTSVELPAEIKDVISPIILFVGRFEGKTKRPELFLEAVGRIKTRLNVTGILCGDGPRLNELKALRSKLGLDADIHFTGFLQPAQVWGIMKKAAALVSSSLFEGCPNAVLEAMACGCPLVVSDIQAHHEILDENCALFFDPYDIQDLVNKIFHALNDIKASNRRSYNAKEKIKSWSIPERANRHERIYREHRLL